MSTMQAAPSSFPKPGAGRAVTPIAHDGEPVAVLIHDEAVLEDAALVEAVASAARMAVANARLQAEVRARVLELAASRRRIVDAADAQRRRLERELREGAERRLADVASLLEQVRREADEPAAVRVAEVGDELRAARAELHDFAQGIHPAALDRRRPRRGAPRAASRERGCRSSSILSVGRLAPAVEAAVYFLCSEALANAAKHAEASRYDDRRHRVERSPCSWRSRTTASAAPIRPGAPDLRGLADRDRGPRREALRREPRPRGGTRLDAKIPLDAQV